mmetsp:Transcript_7611/g.14453  ORF Transcript_7611/g.14453 Transcript_7611/m.14453 type:complete len:217 (-) Transcript_7611:29-679(-)
MLQVATPKILVNDISLGGFGKVDSFRFLHFSVVFFVRRTKSLLNITGGGRNFLITDPIRDHVSLALDGNLAAFADGKIGGLFGQDLVCLLRTKDAIGFGVGFHTAARIHGITKETIPRVEGTNHIAHNGTRMKAYANVNESLGAVVRVDQNLVGFRHQINRKRGSVLGMGIHVLLFQVGDTHVCISNGLDLKNFVLASHRIERQVKTIQHLRHLHR